MLGLVAGWARRRSDVKGLALVGSYARGAARPDSDVDLVLLTDDPAPYLNDDKWLTALTPAMMMRTKRWGAVVERRFRLESGIEVEINIARPSWANTDSADAGTLRVIRDGIRILYDPLGLLEKLIAASR
jgi:hypothetical protein